MVGNVVRKCILQNLTFSPHMFCNVGFCLRFSWVYSVCVFSVAVPPNIAGESAPQDVPVLQGRQVTLECKSDAVPPPTLTWLKDGAPLQVLPNNRPLPLRQEEHIS